MAEVVTAERWLVQVLKADTSLMALTPRVYTMPTPQGAQVPLVLIGEVSASDLMAIGARRIWTNGLWTVRAVFESASWAGNLEAAANRIDAVLHAASGAPTGGNVWACVRERPFRLVENNGGQQLRHLGGIYRIFVK